MTGAQAAPVTAPRKRRDGWEAERSDVRSLSRAEALASTLPALLVAAERVASTVSQGVHGRRRVGDGETFWQFRRYQPGDPAPRIDWRQSAKTDRVYVRETEWEAAQSVWLWRDRSASMRWRSSPERQIKLDRAELLMLALSALLTRGGEQVALLGRRSPPASGRAALLRIAALLERDRPSGADDGLPIVEPLPRHGRLVLFGDFLTPLEEIAQSIGAFARRGVLGHLVQIVDPAEETLPFSGRVLFEGSEHEGHLLFGRVESVRDDYRKAFARHQAGLREVARSAGWTMLTHHTHHGPNAALLALYLTLTGPLRG